MAEDRRERYGRTPAPPNLMVALFSIPLNAPAGPMMLKSLELNMDAHKPPQNAVDTPIKGAAGSPPETEAMPKEIDKGTLTSDLVVSVAHFCSTTVEAALQETNSPFYVYGSLVRMWPWPLSAQTASCRSALGAAAGIPNESSNGTSCPHPPARRRL